MDDMAAEVEEPGGKGKFPSGLNAKGITKMHENPAIPQLFSDLFKNACLPYRDPKTLRAFLKIIDEWWRWMASGLLLLQKWRSSGGR